MRAPDFDLPAVSGERFALADRNGQPLVLVFFRGGWWPYCRQQLVQLQQRLAEFEARGARVVAIAPDSLDGLAKMVDSGALTFPVLSDAESAVVKAYGVLNAEQGSLPHPAAFVVDAHGVVRFRHVDPNYRERPDVSVLLAAVSALGEAPRTAAAPAAGSSRR